MMVNWGIDNMEGPSTLPHRLGSGQTTYSLGLIRPTEEPKFPVTQNKKDRNLLCQADSGIRHTFLEGHSEGFCYSKGAVLRRSPLRACRGPPAAYWDPGHTDLSCKS